MEKVLERRKLEEGTGGEAGDEQRRRPGGEGSRPRARPRGYDERIRPIHVIRNTIAPPIPLSSKICGKFSQPSYNLPSRDPSDQKAEQPSISDSLLFLHSRATCFRAFLLAVAKAEQFMKFISKALVTIGTASSSFLQETSIPVLIAARKLGVEMFRKHLTRDQACIYMCFASGIGLDVTRRRSIHKQRMKTRLGRSSQ